MVTSPRPLLIIEAPGKLKKLRSILGTQYDIRASGGHIRELASDDDESLGFQFTSNRVQCRWSARDAKAKTTISDLRAAAKQASSVILATDEDREGETIAWHLADALGLKNPQRITYREITESAVRAALAHPRSINLALVDAGLCRSVLDKLVGYRGSPLVWQLNNGAKSIGRVQSAALHLVVELENKIRSFTPQDYWSVWVEYAEGFKAFCDGGSTESLEEAPLNDAVDPAPIKALESDRVRSHAEAERLVTVARSLSHKVLQVEGKTVSRTPPPPFTTSTLQQAAGAKLKFAPDRTMALAQKLYEQGHITYHRTDATFLSPEFEESARHWLSIHDPQNLPQKTTQHRSGKNAQEAHEAIRPTDVERTSSTLKTPLEEDALALYRMIWNRTISSLCAAARIRQTRVVTQSGEVRWLAKGQIIEFEGFAKYWRSLGEDAELPALQLRQPLTLKKAAHEKKQTQPPSRYSEAQLVQVLERKGIGRPSTYAPTIQVLKTRQYVEVVKGKLQPTEMGMQVDRFLGQALPDLIKSDFTAEMERSLDLIASGTLNWESWLIGWNQSYFAPALDKAKQILPDPADATPKKTQQVSEIQCPTCQQAMTEIRSPKVSKGYFLKCLSCQDSVLFWSDLGSCWKPPRPPEEPSNRELTSFPCPVCKKLLERYLYQKEGEPKQLLRCSDAKARSQKNHANVVYFYTAKGTFWSSKYGEVSPPKATLSTPLKNHSESAQSPLSNR